MNTTMEPEVSQNSGRSILDRTVCVTLELYGIGNSKQVSSQKVQQIEGETEEARIDRALVRASKTLLESPELKAIRQLDGQIRNYVRSQCLPYKVGIHLIPNELVTTIEEKLQEFKKQREELVEKFLSAYPDQIKAAEQRLLSLFCENDYKPASAIREGFRFEWQYVNFGTPGKLREISPDFFKREQEKAERKWQQATEAVQQVLRVQMSELLGKLQDKLTPNADGKPKTFRNSTVENVRQFLETFDIRNVTNDDQLEDLVNRARAMMANINPQDIRDNEAIRDGIQKGFGEIKAQLDTMVVEGKGRAISFEEE